MYFQYSLILQQGSDLLQAHLTIKAERWMSGSTKLVVVLLSVLGRPQRAKSLASRQARSSDIQTVVIAVLVARVIAEHGGWSKCGQGLTGWKEKGEGTLSVCCRREGCVSLCGNLGGKGVSESVSLVLLARWMLKCFHYWNWVPLTLQCCLWCFQFMTFLTVWEVSGYSFWLQKCKCTLKTHNNTSCIRRDVKKRNTKWKIYRNIYVHKYLKYIINIK